MPQTKANQLTLAQIEERNKQHLSGELGQYGAAKLFGRINVDLNSDHSLQKTIFNKTGCYGVLLGINPPLTAKQETEISPKELAATRAKNADIGLIWNLTAKRGHALCISHTGGGKNTNLITPALLSYCGNILCLDPKGENAWITAQRRREMGQKVVILDPWDQVNKVYASKVGVREKISRFNPLASLDPASPEFNDDVSAIAEGIIIKSSKEAPHWVDSATQLVSGLIAAVVERAPGVASFRDVRQLITATDGELLKIVQKIVERNPNSLAGRKLRRFSKTATTELQSIRSTAETQTAIFDAARLLCAMEDINAQERTRGAMIDASKMLDTMETHDVESDSFDLAELATGKVTLFLVLPFGMLETHGRWMRLIIQMALRTIARLETPPDPPILFLLDELGTINPGGGLSMVGQAYGLLGGMGVRCWSFFQTLDQLQRDYPDSWQSFIGNSETVQLMKVNEGNTAGHFSNHLGNYTAPRGGFQMEARPLKLPQEIMSIPDNHVLSMWSGGRNYQMETVPYFLEPRWNGMYRPNPLHPLPAWAANLFPNAKGLRIAAAPVAPPPPPLPVPLTLIESLTVRWDSWSKLKKAGAIIFGLWLFLQLVRWAASMSQPHF